MFRKFSNYILVITLMSIATISYGQATKSPFSRLGIGDIVEPNLVNNQGMGGVGISNGNIWHLNYKNPALLPRNTLTVFSAGYIGGYQTLRDSVKTESNGGGNLNYLILAFPVMPGKWTTSVGILPYSVIDFVQTSREPVSGSPSDTTLITEEGSGGLNKFFWSNGYTLNKNFSIGLEASYIFGSATAEFSNTILTSENSFNYSPTVSTEINVNDFLFKAGVAFRKDSIMNSATRIQAGITYDFATDLSAKRTQTYERRLLGQPTSRDTLSFEEPGFYRLPSALGIGLSFTQEFKWTVGMDLKLQNWSEFLDYNGSNQNFKNTFSIGVGGEFTPDASSVDSYLERITYRFGVNYTTLPYVPRLASGEQVKDFGINFGWTLPVGRFSSIDMAFKVGQRGDVQNNYIKENYYKIYIGFTFNDQWFIKRKYD
ncbi:hypothetical protein [Fulvivirga sedimenti]|uniref:Aromatic hydrocarbon degradation protein n=1 Tax=Fulvivirga sedimenti TaxID=2879465 RepID=A0A9X1L2H0_9BACT|nr:hypothetical protein [Fulvivirga sedimenti]MCA6078181.1 hypothetical protein [Fulvivirga sedimenti]